VSKFWKEQITIMCQNSGLKTYLTLKFSDSDKLLSPVAIEKIHQATNKSSLTQFSLILEKFPRYELY